MFLILIGELFLNLDQVTRIVPVVGGMPGALRVFFTDGDCREIEKPDANVLRAWLAANALDIGAPQPPTPAQIVADPPAGYAPAQPPATPAEACARFFVRYGAIVGGSSWEDVRRYLRRPSAVEPATVEQWIAIAEAVRDRSRAPVSPALAARRTVARH